MPNKDPKNFRPRLKPVAFAALIALILIIGIAIRDWQCHELYASANHLTCMIVR